LSPTQLQLRGYLLLFLGIFTIFCELLWINYMLTGNVPPERMGEYILVILLCLGVIAVCFYFFWWSRRERRHFIVNADDGFVVHTFTMECRNIKGK